MESVLRGILVYIILFVTIRIGGKRMIQTSTPFGLILTFLISSSVADALKNEDRSITNSFILVCTLLSIHVLALNLKQKFRIAEKIIDDVPLLLINNGELQKETMRKGNVTEEDILASGRKQQIRNLDQVKYAVLEINGDISIIEKKSE